MDVEQRERQVKNWADRLLADAVAMDYATAMEIAENTMVKEEAKEEAADVDNT